ncbi:hypothetical protein EFY79_17050 [Hanamia caeni]|uniref:Uncharacterized protein n=2 Tax=Hanamia caeni TaxID=2294116 RepID=A0A3M9NAM7_9BACT|nr:hypothetical protein EFY79_17050 [Hanamia caeni]
MGNLLNRIEIEESFSAIRSFLQAGGLNPIDHHLNLELEVYVKRQNFTGRFEIECRDYLDNISYILCSDVFKANGFYRPVWTAYNLFSFNNTTQELSFQLDKDKYIINHLK